MINKNETYTIEITGMSHEGKGIGKVSGFTIFVDGAMLGETVEIIIVKLNKNYGFGKLVSITKPSPNRVKPMCNVFKRCGGCQLQHLSYEEQLRFKTQMVKDTVKRIGSLQDVTIHNILGMKYPTRYRNKVQYPIGIKNDKAYLGFYSSRSHEIIEADDCLIQHDVTQMILKDVLDFINRYHISIYNEKEHTGLIRHLICRIGFKTDEVMLIVVTNGDELPNKEILIDTIAKKYPKVKSIVQNINTKKSNVIMGEECNILYGDAYISDYIGEFKFNISPLSFYQVNPTQTEVLYNKALEYANLTDEETVFDAYCGIGTISLFLAKHAKKVYGIEVVEQAIFDARRNTVFNNANNVEFILGESEKVIPEMHKIGKNADVVVVDPPRKGCDKELLDTIIEMKPKRFVYISCDVATLARDLDYLNKAGFRVVEIQPVDMFPHTYHVECCVRIEKQ